VDLKAYYAEQRRRNKIANQDFAARTHGWKFGLTPAAATTRWPVLGNDRSAPVPPDRLTRLVLAADRAGVLLKPEPGEIRSAFSTRDPDSEETTGEGFGFFPSTAPYLVVYGSEAISYASLRGLTAYDVLVKVMDTFATPRASFQQS
jgi:hypothetical protein